MIDPVQLKEVNDLIDNDAAHQKYVAQLGNCELCKNKATDEMEFETGNNAEYAVTIPLCDDHLKELEDTGYDFETKYGEQIEEALCEKWRGQADHMRDEAKYK
mgnify:CR=1 FL=1